MPNTKYKLTMLYEGFMYWLALVEVAFYFMQKTAWDLIGLDDEWRVIQNFRFP